MASCPSCGHRHLIKRRSDNIRYCPHCGPMPDLQAYAYSALMGGVPVLVIDSLSELGAELERRCLSQPQSNTAGSA